MSTSVNIILKVYVNSELEDFSSDTLDSIILELKQLSFDVFEENDRDDSYVELTTSANHAAPLDKFQEICNTYGCEIIGVAYEFSESYVEAFELYSELTNIEDTSNHYIPMIASEFYNEETPPIDGDENMI